jgi:hypothetical protein
MATSRRLRQLLTRLSFLENNILPAERVDGNYTKREQDLIRSFVLLTHAEIEAYLEDVAKTKVTKSLSDWNSSRVKSNCIKSVVSFVGNDLKFENDANSNNIQYRVNTTVAHYMRAVVDKNHGIKEKNILKVLLPLGIEINELDQTWLSVMESFGSTRGLFAHKSFNVQTSIDRNTELNRIKNQILPELTNIDLLIKKLK